MEDWLFAVVVASGASGVILTAILRIVPPRHVANKVGESVRKRSGVYPDIDSGYLNRLGYWLSAARYAAFLVFAVSLAGGAYLGL